MWIKICGIQTTETAIKAVNYGADAIGFVFGPSRRRVTPDLAREIIEALPGPVEKVGVFVNLPAIEVSQIAEYCGLDTLQFHGTETVSYCRSFRQRVIKALRIHREGDLEELKHYSGVDTFLLDAYVPGVPGGTGTSFDWRLAHRARGYGRIIIAGGLHAGNVLSAISAGHPDGVDVSSGVETGGKKDPEKIRRFIDVIRRWESERVT